MTACAVRLTSQYCCDPERLTRIGGIETVGLKVENAVDPPGWVDPKKGAATFSVALVVDMLLRSAVTVVAALPVKAA